MTTTAKPASALLTSIGVNVHLDQPAYAPGGTYTALQSALTGLWPLGGGHLRLSSAPLIADTTGKQAALVNWLSGEQGVLVAPYDFLFTPNAADPPTATQSIYNLCPDAQCMIEGLNEPDENGETNAQTLAFQEQLDRNCVYGPLLGPSITGNNPTYALAQGDLSDYLDYGNAHVYFAGHCPENSGYGASGLVPGAPAYGSLAYVLFVARLTAPAKLIYVTETGFAGPAAQPQYGPLDENTRAQYLLRALLYNFWQGVPRSYVYELVTSNAAEQYGLISALSPLTITPSYTALAGLIAMLADPPHYDAPTVNVTVTAPAGIANVVLRKENGEVLVALWNVNAGLCPNETVTIAASGYQTTAKGAWFWNGAWCSEPVVFESGVATMGVGGAPFFLTLVPE